MVNGVSGSNNTNSLSYWLSIINSQKSQSSSSDSQTLTGSSDSVQLTSKLFNASGKGERANPLSQLVTDGTLTQDQADAINEALRSGKPGDGGNNPLASLITDGTITQDQADSVKSALDANRPKDFMSSIMDNLVSDGTLTQDQADEVKSLMKQGMHEMRGARGMQGPPPPPPPEASASSGSSDDDGTYSAAELAGMSAEQILQLLSTGKITNQEAVAALKGGEDTAMEGVRSSTQRAQQQDPLASLVSSGVISQDQEDAIKAAFRQGTDMNRAMKAYGVE